MEQRLLPYGDLNVGWTTKDFGVTAKASVFFLPQHPDRLWLPPKRAPVVLSLEVMRSKREVSQSSAYNV
jgi:hypothetical protein